MRARAAATRCCWPVLNSNAEKLIIASSGSCICASKRLASFSTLPEFFWAAACRCRENRQGKVILSIGERYGIRLNIWKIIPIWSARNASRLALLSCVISVPLTFTDPFSGTTTPPNTFSSVVLPQPLGPSRKIRSPAFTSNFGISRTSAASRCQRKRTSLNSIISAHASPSVFVKKLNLAT